MSRKLVFATGNPHKLEEVAGILGAEFELLDLKAIGCTEEIPETSETIAGNAIQKAKYVVEHYGMDCFAEDTGLEVKALNDEPGVYSARYAGPQRSAEDNMDLLLERLKDRVDRKARFRTVIALIENGKTQLFEGIINGVILHEKRGSQGFGYDPVFCPDGYEASFAELGKEVKNKISHRAIAVEKFVNYLQRSTGR